MERYTMERLSEKVNVDFHMQQGWGKLYPLHYAVNETIILKKVTSFGRHYQANDYVFHIVKDNIHDGDFLKISRNYFVLINHGNILEL